MDALLNLPPVRTAQTKTDLHPKVSKAFGLFHSTPLVYSPPMSESSGVSVFLKLENTQPSGSFKSRGVGHLCHLSSLDHREQTHLVCSSSGNAALAVAHAARMLQLKATACVHSASSEAIRARLRARGLIVEVADGVGWEFADLLARKIVAEDPYAVYIPPFDHAEVLRGHAEIVRELRDDWDEHFPRHSVRPIKPDAIICACGGGGLLGGMLEGLKKAGWSDVLAVESEKTASLLESLRASWKSAPPEPRVALLDKLGDNTICHSLGSRWATPLVVEKCMAHRPGQVSQITVPEALIPGTIRRVLQDQHFLLEPACAIALVPFYPPAHVDRRALLEAAIPSLKGKASPNIVVIVCGGSFASLEALEGWEAAYEGTEVPPFRVFSQGVESTVSWKTPDGFRMDE